MPEDLKKNHTIIIQPGSFYLKIGLASFDNKPFIIENVIARKKKLLHPMETAINKELLDDFKDILNDTDSIDLNMNGQTLFELNPLTDVGLDSNADVILCENVYTIQNINDYTVRFPIQHGDLNHLIYGSLEELSNDLQLIWQWSLEHHAGIDRSDFKNHRVILLVPDAFKILDIQIMVNIILKEMNFSSCLILQESVAASFWVGSSSSCVVDIGFRKVNVCCISEGISHPKSRVKLNYGSFDLSMNLFTTLQLNKSITINTHNLILMYKLIDDIKKELFKLPVNKNERKNLQAEIMSPLIKTKSSLHINHEMLIATTIEHFLNRQFDQNEDSIVKPFLYQDIHIPEDYLFIRSDVGIRYKKPIKTVHTDGKSSKTNKNPQNMNQENNVQLDSVTENITSANNGEIEEYTPMTLPSTVSLCACIHHSILSFETEEVQRQYYSNILLVGGGLDNVRFIDQFKSCLNSTLNQFTQNKFEPIFLAARDIPSQIVSWMGAVVLDEIDADENLWISQSSFLKNGSKVIRERSLFQTTNMVKI